MSTSCADHVIAWRTRQTFRLNAVPMGVAPDPSDNLISTFKRSKQQGLWTSGCKGDNPSEEIPTSKKPRYSTLSLPALNTIVYESNGLGRGSKRWCLLFHTVSFSYQIGGLLDPSRAVRRHRRIPKQVEIASTPNPVQNLWWISDISGVLVFISRPHVEGSSGALPHLRRKTNARLAELKSGPLCPHLARVQTR